MDGFSSLNFHVTGGFNVDLSTAKTMSTKPGTERRK